MRLIPQDPHLKVRPSSVGHDSSFGERKTKSPRAHWLPVSESVSSRFSQDTGMCAYAWMFTHTQRHIHTDICKDIPTHRHAQTYPPHTHIDAHIHVCSHTHTINHSNRDAEAAGTSSIQGQPPLHKIQNSQGYLARPCLIQKGRRQSRHLGSQSCGAHLLECRS